MITAIEALERWERAFSQDDATPLREMFIDYFVMIDSDGNRQTLDDDAVWATGRDFNIGDFEFVYDENHCCCGTRSATLDSRNNGRVLFFALKSGGRTSLWKI